MASICCSPPDSVPAAWPSRSASLGNSANMRSRFRAWSARARGSIAPISRFSRTVSVGKHLAAFGHLADAEIADPMRRQPAMLPAAQHDAAARCGRSMPAMVRISVVLPAPLAPTIATIAPSATSSETPSSARTSP